MLRAPAGRASHRGPKPNPKIERSKTPLHPFFKKGSHYFRLNCLIEAVIDKNFKSSYKVGESCIKEKNFIKKWDRL